MMYNMIRGPRMVCTEYGFPWCTELLRVTQRGIQLLTKRLGISACQTLILCQWIPQDQETSLFETFHRRCELLVEGLYHTFLFFEMVLHLLHILPKVCYAYTTNVWYLQTLGLFHATSLSTKRATVCAGK